MNELKWETRPKLLGYIILKAMKCPPQKRVIGI